MNWGLKKEIDSTANYLGGILTKLGMYTELKGDPEGFIKLDMAQFAMYLSASDGQIKYSEAKVVSDYFDLNITPQNMDDYIRRMNIYSTEFESTPPMTLKMLVDIDNKMYAAGERVDIWPSEKYFALCMLIGKELILADGDADEQEKLDMCTYINMIRDYLRENLIPKNKDTVKAPPKS